MAELSGQRFGFSQPEAVLQAQKQITQLAAVTAGSSGKSANSSLLLLTLNPKPMCSPILKLT